MKTLNFLKLIVFGLVLSFMNSFAVAQDTDTEIDPHEATLYTIAIKSRRVTLDAQRAIADIEEDIEAKTSLDLAREGEYEATVTLLQQEVDNQFLQGAREGNLEMVQEALAEGANIEVKDDNGKTALDLAREGRYRDIVAFLKKQEDKLFQGAREGNVEMVQEALAEEETDREILNTIFQWAREGNVEMVQEILAERETEMEANNQ